MNEQSPIAALQRAVEILGSATAVARVVGKTPQAVSDIIRRKRPAPADWCIPLEKATAEKVQELRAGVSRHDLRPDLYPPDEAAA